MKYSAQSALSEPSWIGLLTDAISLKPMEKAIDCGRLGRVLSGTLPQKRIKIQKTLTPRKGDN